MTRPSACLPHCDECALGAVRDPDACPFQSCERGPGAVLVRQGEVPEAIWYVAEGSVLLSSSSADGRETFCSIRGPRSLVGLEAVKGRATDADAWTLSDATLCRIRPDAFDAWLCGEVSAARAVLEIALDETFRSRSDRIALAGSAEARVARLLVDHARTCTGELAVEQQLLARMLAMRPETFSRAVARLRGRGALARGRQLRITDAALLLRIAEGSTDLT